MGSRNRTDFGAKVNSKYSQTADFGTDQNTIVLWAIITPFKRNDTADCPKILPNDVIGQFEKETKVIAWEMWRKFKIANRSKNMAVTT